MTSIFGFRSDPAAVNSYLVLSDSPAPAAIIVDAGSGPRQANRIFEAFGAVCREMTGAELVTEVPASVIITHDHWDHFFGCVTFAQHGITDFCASAPCIADMAASAWVQLHEVPLEHEPDLPSDPSELLVDVRPLDDGAQLSIPGATFRIFPGHTNGDGILICGDIAIVGDLVEEGAPPSIGPDATPARWAANLSRIAELPGVSVFAPGHGAPVDADFVRGQAADLAEAARTDADEVSARHADSADLAEVPGTFPQGIFRLR